MAAIKGIAIQGYTIESARIERGQFSDSDHYGIVLGRNAEGHYVTWQFHLDEDEKLVMYWGHYFMKDWQAAIRDFNTREQSGSIEESNDPTDSYKVTIIETLKKTITVEAKSREEAEQIVSDNWYDSEYILDAEDFVEVEFIVELSR
jgi:hypothetical protein